MTLAPKMPCISLQEEEKKSKMEVFLQLAFKKSFIELAVSWLFVPKGKYHQISFLPNIPLLFFTLFPSPYLIIPAGNSAALLGKLGK